MDVGVYSYSHGDPILIDKIVNEFLSQGKFDKLRKECMSDADTKPAYQNLQQRVENTVTQFLKKQVWRPDLNKNQLRDSLRKHILESKFFDAGINRIVDQVVNANVLASVFLPEVEEVVYNYLSIPRPSDKIQKRDERIKPPGRDYECKTSQINERFEKYGEEKREGHGDHQKENHLEDEDYRPKDIVEKKFLKDIEISNESIKIEPVDEKEKIEGKTKSEVEKDAEPQLLMPIEKMEIPSDESQESLRGMAVEGLHINEFEAPLIPDSDDSIPLEINEKSMSESRDSEDSILNQMSPISQGRLTPDLDEDLADEKSEEKQEKRSLEKEEEKRPLSFIGRIPKIKREDSDSSKSSQKIKDDTLKKEKLNVKNVYSSDESDSSKSYGKSDSDEKKRKNEKSHKEERKREDSEKRQKDKKGEVSRERKKERSRDRHKDHKRERSRDRHKKSSSSSSSSQREKSSGHHKSSHRHQDSKIRRKEEEKKKNKSTDDHGRERNKKEDRRSTDRDSNERERGRSSGSRTEGDSRRREKEQPKSEEGSREETNQKQEMEMEKENEVVLELQEVQIVAAPQEEITLVNNVEKRGLDSKYDADLLVLDLRELFQSGALSRVEFPKVTDDFYVKFNSTGFRYFEEWEKAKLDCEEEFKEFVDEAENDLSLLSEDGSDSEFEFNFDEENRKTIKNVLKGLGNFRRSLMFDPVTSEFYKWTNNKFYQKFRKKGDIGAWRSTEKNESDESIKENIDRGERNRALHLKLLNKYRRKAMRMRRPRRRHRKPESWGIKEKNENQSASEKEFLNKVNDTETFVTSKVTKLPDCNAVDSDNPTVPDSVNSLNNIYRNKAVTLPDSPEEIEEWSDTQKINKKEKADSNMRNTKLSENLPLNLPPSPDSDDINTNSGVRPKNVTVSNKRISKEREEGETPRKQIRRNYSQKYDSQDLYKPRPVLNRSSSRKRKRGLERDVINLDSPISR